MNGIVRMKEYLEDLYGVDVVLEEFQHFDKLPLFMKKSYKYNHINFFGEEILVVELINDEISMKEIHSINKNLVKYMDNEYTILLVFNIKNEYIRRTCIKGGYSFVVPGVELFFPKLGIAYSKYMKKLKMIKENTTKPRILSAVAQTLLFFIDDEFLIRSQKELAIKLGYSGMSISRAIRELIELNFIIKETINDSISIKLQKPLLQLFNENRSVFINPVLKTYFIKPSEFVILNKDVILSGESDLANRSMLNKPVNDTYSIYKSNWIKYQDNVQFINNDRDKCNIIQVWKHDIPMKNGVIHPLALYLSMKDILDERIKKELESLVEVI